MLYILLAFAVCFSFGIIARRWRVTESVQPRSCANLAGLLENRPPRGCDEEPSEDVLCEIDCNGGQTSSISSIVVLPDGMKLAGACKDNSVIRLWCMELGREIGPPMDLGVAVGAIAASKDGKWIISGGIDGNVAIWDTASHQKEGKSTDAHELKITTLDVSPDSLRIASGSDDGTVMVWRIDSRPTLRPELPSLRHQHAGPSPVSSVKFSPAGGRIASGYNRSGSYTIQIWHSGTGESLALIPTDGQLTRSLAWSRDGRRLFAGGPYGSIRCFDVATRKRLAKWENSQSDVITSLYISNAGQFLIASSASGRTIDIWDIRDIPTCKRLHPYRRSNVLSVAISPNEVHIVSGGKDGRIYRRCISNVIEASYFFHCLTPLPRRSKPLSYISSAAYEVWKDGNLDNTEKVLSHEIADEALRDFTCYARANRSLVRARLRKWDEALQDAETTMLHDGQKPPIAFIAKGIALCGQGKHGDAMNAFDAAQRGSGSDIKPFVTCVKSIIFFEVDLRDRLHPKTDPADLFQDDDTFRLAQALVLLAEHRIRNGDYDKALELLSSAPDLKPFLYTPEAEAIFLIFGWSVHDLYFMIRELKFQALAASGCTRAAIESLGMGENNSSEDIEKRNGILGCLSEKFGDKSMCSMNHDGAIAWYTAALTLSRKSRSAHSISDLACRCLKTFEIVDNATISAKDEATSLYIELLSSHPQKIVSLLLKRSKAKAEKELWKEAMDDANEAIRLDPTCPWCHERRRAAMPVKQSQEDQTGFDSILLTVERQIDQDISHLRKGNIPCDVVIDAAIRRISNFCPLVLIDVTTGLLCDEVERKRIFKGDPTYDELLSSVTSRLDVKHIVRVVARFFRYVMFSHTWEGQEPTFQDVSRSREKSVYKLDPSSRLNEKLRKFCETAKSDRECYRWSWSDTCCIDKTLEAVYKRSIRSMYDWYKWSALTLVLLADDSALKDNRWMTRAWTLQELLSPKIIRFYDHRWKPYLGDTNINHKQSPRIMRELAEAIYVAPDTLADFSPKALSVREKLRLASTRNATVEEDIAYSLIGIFSSNLIPEPRDAAIALGLLLQEIVDRYQETAVLDWTGEPSMFNSCLPARISVYKRLPYVAPSILDDDMERHVGELRDSATLQQDAIKFYRTLSRLDPLHFANHRLHLPCVTFSATVIQRQICRQGTVYLAKASALGEVEFTSMDSMLHQQDRLVLIYPWIRDLFTQAHLREGGPDTQALRLMVLLQQPFRALLLAKHPVHNEYRRVATDNEIFVSRRRFTSTRDMDAERLVVL